jgi:hypothetical protein
MKNPFYRLNSYFSCEIRQKLTSERNIDKKETKVLLTFNKFQVQACTMDEKEMGTCMS